jgi:hypothetical protein
MSRSQRKFERWKSREDSTWAFQVFQKHNQELSAMYIAHIASHEYLYRNLGKSAVWEDPMITHFKFKDDTQERAFKNIKEWSVSFNKFDNWVNLNSAMAMSSNFETYISTIIKLALESDVGVLFGTSKRIDGIEIIKHGRSQPFDFEDKIISCTKGEWGSRVRAFEKIFGNSPSILSDSISDLEKLRKLRNNIGHSFGRDIEASRKHNVIDIVDMEQLKRTKTIAYQKLIFGISKAIDKQLLTNHIGEYQSLYFYHNLRPSLKGEYPLNNHTLGNHTWMLKKGLGRFGAKFAGKIFCKELISYYEAL